MHLKVGEFSRLCQVPIKTLRYYDEIGLFSPLETDRFTNYRYYTLDQLPHIHRIMALKELGLTLEQIAELLSANLSLEEIHAMFLRKQDEVQHRIEEELERLTLVKFHLRQIEQEARLPDLQIVVKKLDSFPALTLRSIFPTQKDIDHVGYEILDALVRDNLKSPALPMGIAYISEFRRENLDYEFVLPTTSLSSLVLETRGTMTPREVPSVTLAATYLHQGDYDTLNDASVSLQRWAIENNYRIGGEMRFVYFRGPMHGIPPTAYLTELQHQIEKL